MLSRRPEGFKPTYKKNILRVLVLTFLMVVLGTVIVLPSFGKSMSSNRENEIKDRLEKILSSKEFKSDEDGKSIFEKISEDIDDFIEKILEKLQGLNKSGNDRAAGSKSTNGTSPLEVLAFKVLAVVIIIVFVFLLVFFILRNFNSSKKVKQKEDMELLAILKDSDTVERTALELYNKGDIRQGIRFLYITFLLRLNEFNIIRIDKSKTNKQYLREVLENGNIHFDMAQEFTYDFNKYWYGNRNVDKEKFDYWYSRYTSALKEDKK